MKRACGVGKTGGRWSAVRRASGGELFSNFTLPANGTFAVNGFDALREFDLNKDGTIRTLENGNKVCGTGSLPFRE